MSHAVPPLNFGCDRDAVVHPFERHWPAALPGPGLSRTGWSRLGRGGCCEDGEEQSRKRTGAYEFE
jgi:hypothetical protein